MKPRSPRSAVRPDTATVATRQEALLAWFDTDGRDLPWRPGPGLYATWVAEVMLQQTTVAAVIPRWQSFLRRFPDVARLAAADEEDVLTAWSGLGYYRRARLLHRAAREVMARHGGQLPTSRDGWRALPGIGDYAAGAIASIGLGLPTAAVDANVKRVLTRWTCADGETAGRMTAADLRALADRHVPAKRAGDWNQALMDLGAGRCRAGEPDCVGCPVGELCAAGRAGTGGEVPPPVPRAGAVPVILSALVARRAGRTLLLPSEAAVVARARGLGRPRRSDLSSLFGGMLGVPSTPWYEGAGRRSAPFVAAWRRWLGQETGPTGQVVACGWVGHAITLYRLQVLVCTVEIATAEARPELDGARWTDMSLDGLPISTLARKVMQRASLSESAG